MNRRELIVGGIVVSIAPALPIPVVAEQFQPIPVIYWMSANTFYVNRGSGFVEFSEVCDEHSWNLE